MAKRKRSGAASSLPVETNEVSDQSPAAKRPPPKKNPAAVALGRLGGKKGGKARAAKMTPEERSESARKAVRARWDRAKKKT